MSKTRRRSRAAGIATRLIAELEDEQTWKTQFEATTDDQWDRMAELVRQEIVRFV